MPSIQPHSCQYYQCDSPLPAAPLTIYNLVTAQSLFAKLKLTHRFSPPKPIMFPVRKVSLFLQLEGVRMSDTLSLNN